MIREREHPEEPERPATDRHPLRGGREPWRPSRRESFRGCSSGQPIRERSSPWGAQGLARSPPCWPGMACSGTILSEAIEQLQGFWRDYTAASSDRRARELFDPAHVASSRHGRRCPGQGPTTSRRWATISSGGCWNAGGFREARALALHAAAPRWRSARSIPRGASASSGDQTSRSTRSCRPRSLRDCLSAGLQALPLEPGDDPGTRLAATLPDRVEAQRDLVDPDQQGRSLEVPGLAGSTPRCPRAGQPGSVGAGATAAPDDQPAAGAGEPHRRPLPPSSTCTGSSWSTTSTASRRWTAAPD